MQELKQLSSPPIPTEHSECASNHVTGRKVVFAKT